MTNPTLPLTDQLPNGRELEAAAQVMHAFDQGWPISVFRGLCKDNPSKWLKRLTEARAQLAELEVDSLGWFFFNPDTGFEFSEQHPIESGEVEDATDIQPATAKLLKSHLIAAWSELDDLRPEVQARPVMALDGDPRGYDAGYAAGVQVAVKGIQDDIRDVSVRLDPKKHKDLSAWFDEQRIAAIRALPAPPNPLPAMEAENIRLRTMLEGIAAFEPAEGAGDPHQQIAVAAKRIARAALEGSGS